MKVAHTVTVPVVDVDVRIEWDDEEGVDVEVDDV